MNGKFSRFLNLERTRKESPAGGERSGSAAPARFDALEEARSPAAPGATPVSATRFGAPVQTGATLEVHETRSEDQPFVRCARCEADNHAFAESCLQCGQDLCTPEQRAFNERLWAKRREEAAREQQALEALRRGRAQAEVEERDARRQLGVALATQVEIETRRRLDQEELRSGSWGWGSRWGRHDLEARLWDRLPIAVRQGAVALFVGVPLLLMLFRGTRPFALALLLVAGSAYFRIRLGRW